MIGPNAAIAPDSTSGYLDARWVNVAKTAVLGASPSDRVRFTFREKSQADPRSRAVPSNYSQADMKAASPLPPTTANGYHRTLNRHEADNEIGVPRMPCRCWGPRAVDRQVP